ncbi:MAG: ferredoxin [Candidatus Bathyarchaeia archaeon]|jgi:ferredoxin
MKFRIEVDREGCIACATCYTLDPAHFEADAEGKSKVIGGTSNGKSEGIFDENNVKDAQEAELSCPVSVIKVSILKE